MRKLVLVSALAAGFAFGAVSGDARACLEAMVETPRPKVVNKPAEIAAAERSLESGQSLLAARAVLRAFPKIESATIDPNNPVQTRALRVMALSVTRLNGALNLSGETAGSADQRAKNLQWPVAKLQALNVARPNDPAVQADLGEAMAKVPSRRAEAMRMLGALADKDLMGSPHAYAALAQLRAAAGDDAGANTALERCKNMATNTSICAAPVAAPST